MSRTRPVLRLPPTPAPRARQSRVLVHVLVLVCGLLGSIPAAHALDVPPLRGRVNDLAELLSSQQRDQLEQKLASYEKGTGHQLALLTVPSLEGDPIEDFSIRVVEQWKLGSEKEDDGLLIVVAAQDREMRIEVGYGLEGDLPDATASRIVRDVMRPAFKQGDFYGGLTAAFDLSMRAVGGESIEVAQPTERRRKRGFPFLFYLMFGGFWLLPMFFGRRRRRGLGGFYIGGLGGGGGFGGGFGGGGGGFGGGGGGFGGGGASGGW